MMAKRMPMGVLRGGVFGNGWLGWEEEKHLVSVLVRLLAHAFSYSAADNERFVDIPTLLLTPSLLEPLLQPLFCALWKRRRILHSCSIACLDKGECRITSCKWLMIRAHCTLLCSLHCDDRS